MSLTQQPAATPSRASLSHVDEILRKFPKPGSSDVIPLLQAVQTRYGYLPAEVLEVIAKRTRISLTRMYGVATFYERFRFKPVGRHLVHACNGTACHVNGAKHVSRAIQQALQIRDRETTLDRMFTLETVACLGCCSLAPVMMVDQKVYGRLTPPGAQKVLKRYQKKTGTA